MVETIKRSIYDWLFYEIHVLNVMCVKRLIYNGIVLIAVCVSIRSLLGIFLNWNPCMAYLRYVIKAKAFSVYAWHLNIDDFWSNENSKFCISKYPVQKSIFKATLEWIDSKFTTFWNSLFVYVCVCAYDISLGVTCVRPLYQNRSYHRCATVNWRHSISVTQAKK